MSPAPSTSTPLNATPTSKPACPSSPTPAAPGCLDFSLTADLLDSGRVNVYERWRSQEDLLAYRAGDGPQEDDSIELLAAHVELHHISASEAP